MFKLLASVCLWFMICPKSFAKTITVSNNPNSPGQYVNLQSAIDAAINGDSLLVSGSSTSYGTVTINKQIFMFGQGYSPVKDISNASIIEGLILTTGSDESIVGGFQISYLSATPSTPLRNIIVKRNYFFNRVAAASMIIINGNGFVFENNLFYYFPSGVSYIINLQNSSNVVIRNNVLARHSGGASTALIISLTSANNISIYNNLFSRFDSPILEIYNAIIANNIFYHKSSSTPNVNLLANSNNCVVSNNICYNNSSTNPFNLGVNNITGLGNLININPLFVTYDLTSFNFNFTTDDFRLQPGSPAINMGTDGTDVGIYGGTTSAQYPLSGEPNIPQIKSMNIENSIVPPNGTLKVRIKANSNN